MASNPILTGAPPTSIDSFQQKLLKLDVQLAPIPGTNTPRFFSTSVAAGQPNANTVTIEGSRMSVRVQNSGLPQGARAQVDVYGLAPSLMNELSTLGMVFQLTPRNTVTISAGTAASGYAIVFIGTVMYAFGDYNKESNVPFHFDLNSGQIDNVITTPAMSYPQPTDVGTIMSSLAKLMGIGFENNGVGPGNTFGVTLPASYFYGSPRDIVKKVADHADIVASPDVFGGQHQRVLAIWPKGGARKIQVPLVSSSTGMIGYPTVSQGFLDVKTVFNPAVGFGGQIRLQTSLDTLGLSQAVNSVWNVLKIDHALDSMMQDGLWESNLWCFNPKYQQPNPAG